jgi:hypothetical protein
MPKLEDSAKGEKSFGVMIYEPPYTRPVWFILSEAEGYGGVRGALSSIMRRAVYSTVVRIFYLISIISFGGGGGGGISNFSFSQIFISVLFVIRS